MGLCESLTNKGKSNGISLNRATYDIITNNETQINKFNKKVL